MIFSRKHLNISLLLLAIALGGTAAWLSGLPPLSFKGKDNKEDTMTEKTPDTVYVAAPSDALISHVSNQKLTTENNAENTEVNSNYRADNTPVRTSGFEDVNPERMIANHPFRKEALKILNNHLEESDSLSRRKILSYCEHLRTSYTTKDIDFIRQVFSDNALIIVGNVVKTGKKSSAGNDAKVAYSVRSKEEYLSRLSEVFKSNSKIKLEFSDFSIMRHPSMKGIYGVSLRQKYSTDKYSDDGYLFLLWDFRNPSMPLIHVRTWQPHKIVAQGEEVIDISDFNIE